MKPIVKPFSPEEVYALGQIATELLADVGADDVDGEPPDTMAARHYARTLLRLVATIDDVIAIARAAVHASPEVNAQLVAIVSAAYDARRRDVS